RAMNALGWPFSAASCIAATSARRRCSGACRVQAASAQAINAIRRHFNTVRAMLPSLRLFHSGRYAATNGGAVPGRTFDTNHMQILEGMMNRERPWLQSYPAGVPAEIDVEEFCSVVSVFDASVARFRDRPAYSNFGKT